MAAKSPPTAPANRLEVEPRDGSRVVGESGNDQLGGCRSHPHKGIEQKLAGRKTTKPTRRNISSPRRVVLGLRNKIGQAAIHHDPAAKPTTDEIKPSSRIKPDNTKSMT
jgi:hypothetical protein